MKQLIFPFRLNKLKNIAANENTNKNESLKIYAMSTVF